MELGKTIVARDDIPGLGPGIGKDLLLQLGPLFFALIWNWMLLGTSIVQTYYYYLSYKRDSIWLKSFVYSILVLDLTQTALSTHTSFHTFVLYYGNPLALQMPTRTIIGLPLFGGLVGGCVQLFYAWRIWTLARWAYRSVWLMVFVGVVICTSLVSTVCGVTGAFIYLKVDTQAGIYATDLTKLFATWYSAGFAVDVLIAVAMVFIVTNAKTNTTFKRTNDILTNILLRAVATGIVNAIINGLGVLFLYAWPLYDLSEFPTFVGGKLYANTLLVTLNSRYTDSESYTHAPPSTTNNSSPGRTGPNIIADGKQLESIKFAPGFRSGDSTTQSGGISSGISRDGFAVGSGMMTRSTDEERGASQDEIELKMVGGQETSDVLHVA